MTQNLFSHAAQRDHVHEPLAERMRPRGLDEVVGQTALLGPSGPLRRLLRRGAHLSCIFVGPPGVGKTTLGRLCASELGAEFVALSAVSAGLADLRQAAERARLLREQHRKKTLVFIDEIHRFHRGQQDALLPHVESGVFALIGATTENPRFTLTRALLSRCRVFDLTPLKDEEIQTLCRRALRDSERGLGTGGYQLTEAAEQELVAIAGGDARRALGLLESAAHLASDAQQKIIDEVMVASLLEKKLLTHDRAGESHYDLASALIKSMRQSDERASAYYLARMVEGGESLDFLLRRMCIFASEDIGLADPQALPLVQACAASVERIGMPEAWYPLMHAVLYLARAAKSRAVVRARDAARTWVDNFGSLPVPAHVLNATSHERQRQERAGHRDTSQSSCLPAELAEWLRSET